MGVFSILQSNRKFYHILTLTIVINKFRNLIGTGGIAKFGPKSGQVFQSNTMSLYCPKRHHQVKEHRETRDSSSSVYSFTMTFRPFLLRRALAARLLLRALTAWTKIFKKEAGPDKSPGVHLGEKEQGCACQKKLP